jgi:hypothetical protein
LPQSGPLGAAGTNAAEASLPRRSFEDSAL